MEREFTKGDKEVLTMAKPKIIGAGGAPEKEERKKPQIASTSADDDKSKDEGVILRVKGRDKPKAMAITSSFEARLKDPGELLTAQDWNDMQKELHTDLNGLCRTLDQLSRHTTMMASSGITSHGLYVELNWDVKPFVLFSLAGTVEPMIQYRPIRCFPHDITSKGFMVYAQTDDGKTRGIVNWLAIGLRI